MTPHRYHSTAPRRGNCDDDDAKGDRRSILALNLHDRHWVMPSTGPNDKFEAVNSMVRGNTKAVGHPRAHRCGTRKGEKAEETASEIVTLSPLGLSLDGASGADDTIAAANADAAATLAAPRTVYCWLALYSLRRRRRIASRAANRDTSVAGRAFGCPAVADCDADNGAATASGCLTVTIVSMPEGPAATMESVAAGSASATGPQGCWCRGDAPTTWCGTATRKSDAPRYPMSRRGEVPTTRCDTMTRENGVAWCLIAWGWGMARTELAIQ